MREFGAQGSFLRNDLKAIQVPHEQGKEREGQEVGEVDRPSRKNQEETEIHRVTGEAVDA